MYENPKFDANNEKILCEMNGKNADMLMDIKTKILKAGESVTVCDEDNETAIQASEIPSRCCEGCGGCFCRSTLFDSFLYDEQRLRNVSADPYRR